jgi:hypothetical protein
MVLAPTAVSDAAGAVAAFAVLAVLVMLVVQLRPQHRA